MTKLSLLVSCWLCMALGPSPAMADSRMEVKQLHMCCDGCAEEVESVLKGIEGVSNVQVTRKTRTAAFTATDSAAAQKAIDALAKDGFHGKVSDKTIHFKSEGGIPEGKVTSLTLTGFHNTCPGCVKAFRVALKKVEGVTSDDCKSKVTTCTIKGNFEAAAVVKALNEEGFHVRVK